MTRLSWSVVSVTVGALAILAGRRAWDARRLARAWAGQTDTLDDLR